VQTPSGFLKLCLKTLRLLRTDFGSLTVITELLGGRSYATQCFLY
jgi:hypothetical protein